MAKQRFQSYHSNSEKSFGSGRSPINNLEVLRAEKLLPTLNTSSACSSTDTQHVSLHY